MNDELFAELIASIEEAGHIVRGEISASRTFTVECEPLERTDVEPVANWPYCQDDVQP